jgi:hypothetical protein
MERNLAKKSFLGEREAEELLKTLAVMQIDW